MNSNSEGLCSICCLGYNHAKFLSENIKAIWSGDYEQVEIIAVDDGSSDNSVELLNELAAKSSCPMMVIVQANTGNIGKNFNTALKKANGEYVVFISLDDVLYTDAISKPLELMQLDPSIAFVARSRIMGIDNEGNIADIIEPLKLDLIDDPTVDELLNLELTGFGSFYIQSAVFRKSIVNAVNGFDEDMTGDDIILRTKVLLYLKEHPEYCFKIIKEPSCYYRMHSNNIHKNLVRQIKIVTEYLQRYWQDRDNPDILTSWVAHVINKLPFEEYMKIFTLNQRANLLLLDSRVQRAIKDSIKDSIIQNRKTLTNYIYQKRKLPDRKRTITLFSCLTFSYYKREKCD